MRRVLCRGHSTADEFGLLQQPTRAAVGSSTHIAMFAIRSQHCSDDVAYCCRGNADLFRGKLDLAIADFSAAV